MSKIFQYNKKYFLFALLLLCIELLIARYARDQIIRPYVGDFLAVILLCCIVRCFTCISVSRTCTYVLLFSYAIEMLQYFKLADKLGFRYGSLPYILLGNYFSWADILTYTLGIATVIIIERYSAVVRKKRLSCKGPNPDSHSVAPLTTFQRLTILFLLLI